MISNRVQGIFGVLAGLLWMSAPLLAARPAYKPGEVVVKEGYALIPLAYDRDANRLFVDVKINGTSATLLLDTGAPFCILPLSKGVHFQLAPAVAEKGPDKGRREVKLNDQPALLAQVKDFSIGPVHSSNLKMAEMQAMEGVSGHFTQGELAGMGVDGLLGANFLLEHGAVIDVQRHELFLRVDARAPDVFASALPKGKWTGIPFTVGETKIYVPAQLEGVASRFILDTGAPITALSERLCQQAGVRGSFLTFSSGVLGYGDDREGKGTVKDLRIGSYAVQNQELAVSPSIDHALGQTKGKGPLIAGLLGVDFLGNNLAFIDYRNKTLYLKRP